MSHIWVWVELWIDGKIITYIGNKEMDLEMSRPKKKKHEYRTICVTIIYKMRFKTNIYEWLNESISFTHLT